MKTAYGPVGVGGLKALVRPKCDHLTAYVFWHRSHMVLLGGTMLGGLKALVRLRFGIDAQKDVAMNLTCRCSTTAMSEAVHMIISDA